MAIDCSKLSASINANCPTPARQFQRVGYVAPYDGIYDVVVTNNTVKFKTRYGFLPIYDRAVKPFNGTQIAGEQGDYYVKFKETVQFPVLNNDAANAEAIEAISKGKVVIILENVERGTNDTSRYQVFGINGGLSLLNANADASQDIAWTATLEQQNSKYASLFVYDTDLAGTTDLVDKLFNYDWITAWFDASSSNIVYLKVDSDKTCYYYDHVGTRYSSTSGVINTTDTTAYYMTMLVPKATSQFYTHYAGMGATYYGSITTILSGIIDLTGFGGTYVSAKNANTISVSDSLVQILETRNANLIYAIGAALTAKSIADIMRNAVLTGIAAGEIAVEGGSNAAIGTWSSEAVADKNTLVSRGWYITYNS